MPEYYYKESQFEVKDKVEQAKKPFEKSPQQLERELTSEELRERLRDPSFLPTREQIIKAFTTLKQWIEFCFDKEKPVFEFFNEEYLNAFADYFVGKIQERGASEERSLVILEIGAGNGKLSYFLQQKLEERAPGQIKVVATDSGAWGIKSDFPVEQLDHKKAIKQYRPDIVICSWMPYQEDWTKDIRMCDRVKEYILIGETDYGCCGDHWETWGKSWPWGVDDEGGEKIPPYEVDGFGRKDLDELSDLQVCRTDSPGNYHHSQTVSFKRKNNA